jgi:hypothetical protein
MLEMTALPSSSVGRSVRTAVVVTGSRRAVGVPDAALSGGGTNCVVVRGHGRKAGAPEALVQALVQANVEVAVIPSLSVLHPTSPARALGIAAALRSVLVVQSVAEPWLSTADTATLCCVAAYLQSAETRRETKNGAQRVARAARLGRQLGRPSKSLSVPVEEAQRLVVELGWRGAAKKIGLSAASIRRALAKAGLLERRSSTGRSA